MKSVAIVAVTAALLLHPANARAEAAKPSTKAGEEYVITRTYETSHKTSDGSSGSSNGRDTLVERVIAVRDNGLELEYDLPKNAMAADGGREWRFPVRIFRPSHGPVQLLNRTELEARVERWLKAARLDRSACGRWVFTWNAFRIECEPEAAIRAIEAFDLRIDELREGASYQIPEARGPGTLTRKAAEPNRATFAVTMEINPDAVHRNRAESDVALGEIMREPVTLEAALRKRAKESISGTVSVKLDADSAGTVWRRTKVTELKTRRQDGESETATVTETVERQPISESPAHR